MTDLVACLSTGKGTWVHVAKLIKDQNWDKVFLITNQFGKEKFTPDEKTELIVVDSNKPINELVEDIRKSLVGKLSMGDAAVNLISGTGKEHMALLSALLKLGAGIRLIVSTDSGVKEV